MAEESGLVFNPHPERVPNSRRALELSEWARTFGGDAHERIHDTIMDAYWVDARDITAWEVLETATTAAGLDPISGRLAVESGDFARAVDQSTNWAHQHRISGVPAFIIDSRFLVSGAAPHEAFEQALAQTAQARAAAT